MDFLTLATKYLGVEFDEIFIMQRGDCGEIRCKIDRMGLWEYRNSLTECQLVNNDLVKLLSGEYKIKQIDKKEDSKKILPIHCMKMEEITIGGWFQRINEGLDRLKEVVLEAEGGLNLCLTKRWWQGGDYGIPRCDECASEHRQLAAWLKELMEQRVIATKLGGFKDE